MHVHSAKRTQMLLQGGKTSQKYMPQALSMKIKKNV